MNAIIFFIASGAVILALIAFAPSDRIIVAGDKAPRYVMPAPHARNQSTSPTLYMPTTGSLTGLELATKYSSSATLGAECASMLIPPNNTVGGACWTDTSGARPILKIYDGLAWVPVR